MTAERTSDAPLPETRHGFLGAERRTFGSYHEPRAPSRNVGYVICPPLGYEGVHCYRTLRLLAQELAEAGVPALRIDYDGTGESLGADTDPDRLVAWKRSIVDAVQALSAVPGVEAVGLIGLRMGATLASWAAGEVQVDSLVLWEPFAGGSWFARELEILAASGVRSDATGDALESGLHAAGYRFTQTTLDDLKALDVEAIEPLHAPDTFVIWRDDRPANPRFPDRLAEVGCGVVVEQLPGHKEMMTGSNPMHAVAPLEIIVRIRDWVCDRGYMAETAIGEPELTPELSSDGLRHRFFRFGPQKRLFGVLTAPAGEERREIEASDPVAGVDAGRGPKEGAQEGDSRQNGGPAPVLMLTGGLVPRVSVNRMYVELARRLARKGHTVLRMDVSGIGESRPEEGQEDNQTFPPGFMTDVRAGMATVSAEGGGEPWLVGLCSGGYGAFQGALADSGVRGTVMINPATFYLKEGAAADSLEVKQFAEAEHYRRSMFKLSKWKKLLSGGVDVRHILRLVWIRIRTTVSARLGGLTITGHEPTGLAPDLERIMERSTSMNLAFTPGDQSEAGFSALVGSRLARLEEAGLAVRMFEGADHTFSPLGVRGELMDWIQELVSERGRAP